jgi:transposase
MRSSTPTACRSSSNSPKARPTTVAPPATCSDRWRQGTSADRAYDSDALRRTLAERGAWANVKPMPNRRNVPAFSSFLYRYRNLVERFFNKLKHFRAVATRYDKTPENYLASVKLASARIWMRVNESMT